MKDQKKEYTEIVWGTAKRFDLKKGDTLTVSFPSDVKQLTDLYFIGFSPTLTIDNNFMGRGRRKIYANTGTVLYDVDERPVMKIVKQSRDELRTDISMPGCRRSVYKRIYSIDRDGCRDMLAKALDVKQSSINGTVNTFWEMDYDEKGNFSISRFKAKKGDFATFEALADCVVGVTGCPAGRKEGKGKVGVTVTRGAGR